MPLGFDIRMERGTNPASILHSVYTPVLSCFRGGGFPLLFWNICTVNPCPRVDRVAATPRDEGKRGETISGGSKDTGGQK